ncbi:uncharacterized protein EKO05_0006933 [Ascochyta rabiei]|uniref:Uncharacterized protein n=1 Tax=Didymella rabiei TaxID=5454 RepID=A0A162Z3B1_DIDRA|nr:uncharacterized protein EKO05_0006933 [Ascochyta rabiei]KZM20377.1 hypothetical protein ST47_g8497 [Ascochyta rabiei]UPX16539.1 hypothetical protein EKO05_0006933 [Ascochyta rabiei]
MSDPTLQLPRILCLHGVGSNADVLFLQTRALRDKLSSSFRFVFANGPFFCEAGPGMLPVYGGAEPFRRWLRWSASHRVLKPQFHIETIRRCLEDAMTEDDEAGATGPWVGFLGFSQGARLSASLLYETQRRQSLRDANESVWGYEGEDVETKLWKQDWKFAVLFSGPAPLVALSPGLEDIPLQSPTELDVSYKEPDKLDPTGKVFIDRPTLHIIGLQDEWVSSQRTLCYKYCSAASRTLLEWEGDHRIPIEPQQVELIAQHMVAMAGMKTETK